MKKVSTPLRCAKEGFGSLEILLSFVVQTYNSKKRK